MPGKGTGGTSFEAMSHEQMLAWLDQANAGMVQSAAERLTAAAKEIRKIAEELKVRPQWVEWKGEGADAFRRWSGDLANATLLLGDFSQDSGSWLGHASDAIAQVQASIPRDKGSAQANLDAATAAYNDPDAAAVSSKSSSELAALAANKEKVRQEAATQMTKLGQAYQLSATQMNGLPRPKFPPPPLKLQPAADSRWADEVVSTGQSGARASSGSGAAGISTSDGSHRAVAEATGGGGAAHVEPHSHGTTQQPLPDVPDPGHMKIDGTDVLPHTPSAPPVSPVGPPNGGRPDGGGSLPTGTIPPTFGGVPSPPTIPPGLGRTTIGGRSSAPPGRGQAGPVSRNVPGIGSTAEPEGPTGSARPVTGGRTAVPPVRGITGAAPGRMPGGNNGIVGGRPTSSPAGSPAGRSTSGMPRGTVVGGEEQGSAGGRGPTGQRAPAGTGRAGTGQSATPTGRRGMSTGADADHGVVGGRPQPQKRSGTRPFTPGGSGLVRNQDSADGTPASSTAGRTGAGPNGTRPSNARESDKQNNKQGSRADDRSEEQETEQQNGSSTT